MAFSRTTLKGLPETVNFRCRLPREVGHYCMPIHNGLYTEPELHHIRMLYAEMVTVCDRQLGRLMKAIHKLGYDENTMLWMVSDHGQPLGNGEHGHGLMRKCRPWPYEELAHAPSIIRVPGAKSGQRISSFIQSVDVAPTV
ncbi:sulfatase-like hydrolase/transferase, partial [Patescibacteria group bacterium]|nr:sulfatase-like hydrolase/transferase [Patescibacteria group bacterium]